MKFRTYICAVIGAGIFPDDGYRPAITDYNIARWTALDGRLNPTLQDGLMLVTAEVTDRQHADIIADRRVTEIPDSIADSTRVQTFFAQIGITRDTPSRLDDLVPLIRHEFLERSRAS